MMVFGYRAAYSGDFGDAPVIQAGGYKLIDLNNLGKTMPLGLRILTCMAEEAGADFLVIDPQARGDDRATFIDVREAA